jgi:hypothetical protein
MVLGDEFTYWDALFCSFTFLPFVFTVKLPGSSDELFNYSSVYLCASFSPDKILFSVLIWAWACARGVVIDTLETWGTFVVVCNGVAVLTFWTVPSIFYYYWCCYILLYTIFVTFLATTSFSCYFLFPLPVVNSSQISLAFFICSSYLAFLALSLDG